MALASSRRAGGVVCAPYGAAHEPIGSHRTNLTQRSPSASTVNHGAPSLRPVGVLPAAGFSSPGRCRFGGRGGGSGSRSIGHWAYGRTHRTGELRGGVHRVGSRGGARLLCAGRGGLPPL